MSSGIAWLGESASDGRLEQEQWGSNDTLRVPLSDRGLLLADGLFETVLVWQGRPQLLAAHLQRWRQGADLLGLAAPPLARMPGLIKEAIERSGITSGALRLSWSRGTPLQGANRGLDLPLDSRHRCWLQLQPHQPLFTAVRVGVSVSEIRSATSVLSRCKSLGYGAAIQARRQAQADGHDDALLASSAGGLCCGSAANLLVRHGDRWLTPPESSGCLPGVMRGQALALGLAREAGPGELAVAVVASSNGALLLNSLSCRPVVGLNGAAMAWPSGDHPSAIAEALFERLLVADAT